MGQYSIKDIESLSGIKAHTIRIWEQRYDFLTPHRTDTNIRYYSDEQLKMILNIALLNKNGYKISKIAEMDAEQIKDIILHLSDSSDHSDALHDSLIHAMVDFDEIRFEKTLNAAIIRMGFAQTFEHLIIPFLERTGLLWSTGVIKPIQEHFMSNLIKRKLAVAIDSQFVTRDSNTRKFVLFLPEGEWHELMLLYTDLLLRTHHQEVIYLGCSVPMEDIQSLGAVFKPDYLVSFITSPLQAITIQRFINELSGTYPDLKILLGGPQVSMLKPALPTNVIYINNTETLLTHIASDTRILNAI
jgi:DNA-binding transcriptional MerR regulator